MSVDTISDALSTINNASKVGKKECTIKPVSKLIKNVLHLMKEHNYIGEFEIIDNGRGGVIKLQLIGKINKCGSIKPRFPINKKDFEKYEKRYLPAKGFGYLMLTTSKGIMTQEEARQKKVGGALVAYIY
ncbi:MAG: 30S ribosomal protein S8 [Nanoarchaeota archaeon]|nr:30S ribosomal protein S8 [Nanoarchaeota archaeon]